MMGIGKNFAMKKIGKREYWMFGFLLLAVLMWLGIALLGSDKYFDEKEHARQISHFMRGNYSMRADITTIPGYHLVIATVADVLNKPSIQQIRLISFAFSLISIWVFFLLAKKFNAEDPYTRTLQYVFLPISFFYFPILYTDIFSLLLLLAAFYFALSKRYTLSSIFSLAALTVRQNNIVWIAFFFVYTYISENGFSFSLKKLSDHIRNGFGYIITGILFLVFVWFNNGVAFGDQASHQVGFYTGNLYFFLAIVGVLFLPSTIVSLMRMDRTFFKKQVIFSVIIGFILACLFLFFLPGIHEYNLKMRFLRNILLSFAYHQYVWAYACAIFFGCLTLGLMKFKKQMLILFPFTIAYLAPSLLVEQRYLIVPLVFILLFRKEVGPKTEWVNMLYFLSLSAGLVYMLLKLEIFF